MNEAQIDYLVANLIEYFRDLNNEHRWIHAAKLAFDQISRIDSAGSERLERRFLYFASALKNNITASSLRFFAIRCFEHAASIGAIKRQPPQPAKQPAKNISKKVEQRLSQSLAAGNSEREAVQRVANEMLKLKIDRDRQQRVISQANSHPLRHTFNALAPGHGRLAKEDIRNHLLRLNKRPSEKRRGEGVLFGLLQKAQIFSVANTHKLLGDELFFLCRPLGFVDQRSTIVMVEVPSSAHMHALAYKKIDILRALKKDSLFNSAKDIRFRVKKGF